MYVKPRGPRRTGRMLLVAVALVATLSGAAFGIVTLTSGDGGAGSPEAAVKRLFAAIDRADVLGVMEALPPSERDALRRASEQVVDRLKTIRVLDEKASLADARGVTATVTGLTTRSTAITTDLAVVDLTGGRLVLTGDANQAPFGPVVQRILDRQTGPRRATGDNDLRGGRLVAAREADGWYVSITGSILQLVADGGDSSRSVRTLGNPTPAIGAASPEEAVRQLVDALSRFDIERSIGLLDPRSGWVWQAYGSRLAAMVDAGTSPTVTVKRLDLAADQRSATTAVVRASGFEVIVESRSEDGLDTATYTWDGRCMRSTSRFAAPDGSGDVLRPAVISTCQEDNGSAALDVDPFWPVYGKLLSPEVAVVARDGRWYVDPSSTILQTVRAAVGSVDEAAAERWLRFMTGDIWLMYGDQFWKDCGVARPGLDANRQQAERAFERCIGFALSGD
ncbi:MAG: hypothetical protein HYX34_00640 [Actinobacteria bacterium]|nr:hypothetical protein [Actinomycetota bacterium]